MRGTLALLLSTFCVHVAAAGPMPCDQPIRFTAGWFPDPEVDNSKSSTQVTAIGASARGKGIQLGHVVVQTKLTAIPQDTCAGIVVHLEFVKPVLRVASELPAGTCAHASVLIHEYTHVRIYREMAEQFRELVYPWQKGATAASVLAYAKAELDRLRQAQVRFDSPEEYAKSQTLCNGEMVRLVKAAGSQKRAQTPG